MAGPARLPGARRRHAVLVLSLALLLMVQALVAGVAEAQVSKDQAGQLVAEAYDVEVLRVSEGEIEGRSVWLVSVMNPAGDFNEAFQVTTLAVDAETGGLVPSFRHRASGYDSPPGRRDDKVGLRPESTRSGTWR